MAKLFLFFYMFIFSATSLFATEINETKGIIKGAVTTSDGKPAAGVTIMLKGLKKATVTGEDGTFILRNIAAGNYEIEITFIGHAPLIQTVTVESNKTTNVNLQLKLSQSQLQEVTVTATKRAYTANKPSESLRLDQDLIEVPQNIQVITSDVLKDQQVLKMTDGVLRNVSGAVRWEGVGDLYAVIQMRGQWVGAFRNGFNVASGYGPLNEDMSFVEKIEFVKGPAGFLLANGDPGGSYNVVTKKPTGQTKGEASITLGSFDLYRASIDLDGKLTKDGKLLYRFNTAVENSGSFRPYDFNNRYVIAPVLAYRFNDNTQLTLEYTYQRAKMSQFFSNSLFSTKGFATLPRDFTFSNPGFEPAKINDHSAFLNFQHKLNNNWKLTSQLSNFDNSQTALNFDPEEIREDGTAIRGIGSWDAVTQMTLGQVFLNGDFNTGPIQHKVLVGVDAAKKSYMVDWAQWHTLDSPDNPFDVNNPNYGEPANGYPDIDRSKALEVRSVASGGLTNERYSGIYLQDQLGFFDNRLRLTLAGRYSNVSQSFWGDPPAKAKHFTPRLGLSYSINSDFTLYALYDQAFIPQRGLLRNNAKVKPVTGNNMEFGLKKDWFNKNWNTTFSVYKIIKRNELTDDPNNAPGEYYNMVLGEKQAKGIEVDIRGKLFRSMTMVANYAYTKSIVTKVAPGVTDYSVGDIIPGYAKHIINGWFNYTFQKGFLKNYGISAGFSSLLNRETSWEYPAEGVGKLPDYFKLDGSIFWAKDRLKISFNLYNILNDYLYSGSYTSYLHSYFWIAEPPRNVRLNLTYNF